MTNPDRSAANVTGTVVLSAPAKTALHNHRKVAMAVTRAAAHHAG